MQQTQDQRTAAWDSHPDQYYVRYEKVQVQVGLVIAIKVGRRGITGASFEDVTDHVMHYSAYNEDGDYIGSVRKARYLCRKKGIVPEVMIRPDGKRGKTCCIGKSRIDGKWYGWSHRAIYGFKIGDEVKEGDITASSGFVEWYRLEHPDEDLGLPVGFVAKTDEDCKRMAIAFAESVS